MPRAPAVWNYIRSSGVRTTELQEICLSVHWVEKLAERWHVCPNTIRRWARRNLLGRVHRISIHQIAVSSVGCRIFEERYAAILGVGEVALNIRQCAKRYGVAPRTIYAWRKEHAFPEPDHIPGSTINRWRLSQLEIWDRHKGITPVHAIPTEEAP